MSDDQPESKMPWEMESPKKPILVELPPGVEPTIANIFRSDVPLSSLPINQNGNTPPQGRPDETAHSGPPMHPKDRSLFINLCWIGGLIAVFVGGIALIGVYPHWGAGLCIASVAGIVVMALYLYEKTIPWPSAKTALSTAIAVFTVSWIFSIVNIWLAFHRPVQGYSQVQLDAAISKATAGARSDLAVVPQTDLIGGPYVKEDVQRLIPIFIGLNDALTKSAQLYQEEASLFAPGFEYNRRTLDRSSYIADIRSVADKLKADHDAILQIVQKNDLDAIEIRSAIQDMNSPTILTNISELRSLADYMEILASAEAKIQNPVLDREATRASTALDQFNQWVRDSTRNVQAKLRALRDLKL